MPVERFEPSTLAGPVFETGAYTVPPHRLIDYAVYNTASVWRSQEVYFGDLWRTAVYSLRSSAQLSLLDSVTM